MEHYITRVHVDSLINLGDIDINLRSNSRQHLMLTGKNGSGKTTLLNAIRSYLQSINDAHYYGLVHDYPRSQERHERAAANSTSLSERDRVESNKAITNSLYGKYLSGASVAFNNDDGLDGLFKRGEFITAWYPANRSLSLAAVKGVDEITLDDSYPLSASPGNNLSRYLVHLRTQQAYAKNEGDSETEELLEKWFVRFESAIRVLLDDQNAKLVYDFKRYTFKIEQDGKLPYGLDQLSDGYSSVLYILSDLMLRMDHNWLREGSLSSYDAEGIVLIDELETHLHIELQKRALPFFTTFFPRLQFVVSTHSPYILSSISNAKIYDLERRVEMEDLSAYSADEVAEGYFWAEEYSDEIQRKLNRYKELAGKPDVTPSEAAERAELRQELRSIPEFLGSEARDKFEDIERGVVQ